MSGPLDGVRVVELGVWVAGPAAGGILADWGADVIKIEPHAGDPARGFLAMLGGDVPFNPPFELDNRSKRSIVVDLGTPAGQTLALELIDAADVFLTNIRLDALERLGLDATSLRDRHPGLVYGIITGYGLEGGPAAASRDSSPPPAVSPRSSGAGWATTARGWRSPRGSAPR